MLKVLSRLLPLPLLLLPVCAAVAGPPTAAEVLDAAAEAIGGVAAYAKLENRFEQGRLTVPQAGIEGSLITYAARPNKQYSRVEAVAIGTEESGTNGEIAWQLSALTGPQIKAGAERAAALRAAVFDGALRWRELYEQAIYLRADSLAGRACHVVEVTPAIGLPETLYFDQETHLLTRVDMTVASPMGALDIQSYFSDYREVDGVLAPFKNREIFMGGMQVLEFTLESIEHNVEIPADRFDPPAEVQALLDAPAMGGADLLSLGDATFRSREYDEARAIYLRAANAAEMEGDATTRVEALAQVARCYSIRHLGDQGRPHLEQAGALASPTDPLGWSRYQNVKGVYQREDGDREGATVTFTALYDYCLEKALHERAINAAHMVAIAADAETQVAWGLKGIAAAEAGGFEGWLAVLWNNLGWTYDELARYPEALAALETAREYHWKTGDDVAKLIADWSVGHAHRMVGDLQTAGAWMEKTLKWAEARYAAEPGAETAEWVGFSLKEMGEIALLERGANSGRYLLSQALEKLREAQMDQWDAAGFSELSARIEALSKPD